MKLFILLSSLALASTVFALDPARFGGRPFAPGAPMDCLPAAMRVYQELPPTPTCSWKRIVSARHIREEMHHVYCVFALGQQIYAYDVIFGSRRIYPKDRSATEIARAADFSAAYGVYLN